jgi:hypothetical protein
MDQAWRFMPIILIPATPEVKIRRIMVQGQIRRKAQAPI